MKVLASKNMASIKAEALFEIDEMWAAGRQEILGPSADIHQAKYLEAVTGEGLLLKTEAEVLGIPVADLAQSVIQAHQEQLQTLANMEVARQLIQQKVRASTNPIEVARIMKGIRE